MRPRFKSFAVLVTLFVFNEVIVARLHDESVRAANEYSTTLKSEQRSFLYSHMSSSDLSSLRSISNNKNILKKNNVSHKAHKPNEHRIIESEFSERMASRRAAARAKIAQHRPETSSLHKIDSKEFTNIKSKLSNIDPELKKTEHQWIRQMNWNSGNDPDPYESSFLADSGVEYDWWAQGYRLVGGYIDCDTERNDGSHDSGDDDGGNTGCPRWMIWASYYNPNYNGGGREEYFEYGDQDFYKEDEAITDEPLSHLDCHAPDTEWVLIGIYRQEFYQFIEQISKHLWAIDEYEYVVALAGLAYMTDSDCWLVAYDDDGNPIYAGVQPLPLGKFQMSLYSDEQCLFINEHLDMTFDDLGLTSSMKLSSHDEGNDDGYDDDMYATLDGYWKSAQEYTLELLNEVYEEYKYCTLCMDYPTYQDGYFIGDYGTDEDDLINQCWKFHSHDSYTCESDCLSLADSQGTIVEIRYGDKFFGEAWDGSHGSGRETHYDHYKQGYTTDSNQAKFEKFKATMFMTLSGILFISTFLAYTVSRGESKDVEKSRALLTEVERERARSSSRGHSRSKSKHRSKSRGLDDETRVSRKSTSSKRSERSRRSGRSKSKSRRDINEYDDENIIPTRTKSEEEHYRNF